MIICNPRSLAFALLIAALPVEFALAGGSGGRGGAIGAGVGAAGMGSAAVGGGAPAGAVGGGPPIAGIEQPGREWSGWIGQPKQKCRRSPRKSHQCFAGDNKRPDHWRRHWWWRGRSVRAPAYRRYLALRLSQATRIWPRSNGLE
jgi:hypothetical protein